MPLAVRARRRLGAVALVALCAFATASARLFVWPPHDTPTRADAIVVLGGADNRGPTGVALARAGFAGVLAFSVADDRAPRLPAPAGVEVLEFRPDPRSTQGEARAIARLAAARHWRRVIVVSGTPQTTRARMRILRCYSGALVMVPSALVAARLLHDVAYEWGALAKALVLQRTC